MKILIELPTWIGDTVMSSPAIENILNFYNSEEVQIIGPANSIDLIKNNPKIHKSDILKKNYFSLFKISKNLGSFDVFFSFRSSFRSKVLKLFISSKKKYQFDSEENINFHQVEKYNQFVNRSLGINFIAGELNIFEEKEKIKKDSYPILGINPGASYGNAKRWYPEEFAKVCEELSKNYKIIIFGGKKEKDIANDIEKILIMKGITNYQNLAGKTSLVELVNRIANLDLFITGDSGPMHIAANFKIPSITIFGPTKDTETAQWMNQKSIVIKKNLDCQPCMRRICPLGHHNCMKLIKAKDILSAIEAID